MIIGPLPAGYIMAKLAYSRFHRNIADYSKFMFWGVLGSVAPDFDMFYFYLIDHRRTHHHKYLTHSPIVWIGVLGLAILLFYSKTNRKVSVCILMFAVSGFVHLMLDSTVGDVWWLSPFIDKPFSLATVPALYKPWWLNFILHWSFGLELVVLLWAALIWRRVPDNSPRRNLSSVHE